MILQSHHWAYIQTKLNPKKIHVPPCSQQHYSQVPRCGNHLSVINRGMDKEDAAHIHKGTLLSIKKSNYCHLRQHGCSLRLLY